jgi:hypothetical protein
LQWDISAALHTDTLSEYQAYQAALGGPGPMSQWLLVDEIRARNNLDPMAVSQAGFDAAIAAAGVTPETPETPTLPAPAPAEPPAIVGGPPTGNQHPQEA